MLNVREPANNALVAAAKDRRRETRRGLFWGHENLDEVDKRDLPRRAPGA